MVAIVAVVGPLTATLSLIAHHAPQAEFDVLAGHRQLTGSFDKLEWTNPHPFMYVVAKDVMGKEIHWRFEMDGTQRMRQVGFDRTALKPGDSVVVEYWRARDGSNRGYVTKLTLPDGRVFRSWLAYG